MFLRAPLFPVFHFTYPQWDAEMSIYDPRVTAHVPIARAVWNHIPKRRRLRRAGRKNICHIHIFLMSHWTELAEGTGLPLIYLWQQEAPPGPEHIALQPDGGFAQIRKKGGMVDRHLLMSVPLRSKGGKCCVLQLALLIFTWRITYILPSRVNTRTFNQSGKKPRKQSSLQALLSSVRINFPLHWKKKKSMKYLHQVKTLVCFLWTHLTLQNTNCFKMLVFKSVV